MKKSYSFRLDSTLMEQLCQLEHNKTRGITNAIEMYLDKTSTVLHGNTYDSAIVTDYIAELKKDKEILQRRLDFYSYPWYRRLLLPKNK